MTDDMLAHAEELKVLIIDDHAIVRGGIKYLITAQYPKAHFVDCRTPEAAFELLKTQPFNIAFLNLALPDKDGIEMLEGIKKMRPSMPVIILSIAREDALAVRAFTLGAAAFLRKGITEESFYQAFEVALAGRRYVCPDLAERIAEKLEGRSRPSGLSLLSIKEYSIFLRLASGKTLKAIAAELDVSPKTVTTYRSRILRKLKLDSNAELARYAVKQGLID